MLTVTVVTIVGVGCADATDPTVTDVAGAYSAVQFAISGGVAGTTGDLLAGGGHISLLLEEDGSTTGELVMQSGSSAVSLSGTWSLAGTEVSLTHETETFLCATRLVVEGDELAGEYMGADYVITVRLRRVPPNAGLQRTGARAGLRRERLEGSLTRSLTRRIAWRALAPADEALSR
jgi:hypothetical protein